MQPERQKPVYLDLNLDLAISTARPVLEFGLGDKRKVGVLCKLEEGRDAFVPVELFLDMLRLHEALKARP